MLTHPSTHPPRIRTRTVRLHHDRAHHRNKSENCIPFLPEVVVGRSRIFRVRTRRPGFIIFYFFRVGGREGRGGGGGRSIRVRVRVRVREEGGREGEIGTQCLKICAL
jgi:hypothetical protein